MIVVVAGLCPHRVRELRRRRRGRWQARRVGPLGYCWPGRLRPSAPAFVPGLPCHPYLLRHRLAGLSGQRSGEGSYYCPLSFLSKASSAAALFATLAACSRGVARRALRLPAPSSDLEIMSRYTDALPVVDLRGHALLRWLAHHPRWLQEGPQARPESDRGAPPDLSAARIA